MTALVVRIDLNDNADTDRWLEVMADSFRGWDSSSSGEIERMSVIVERPELVWPT